MNCAGREFAKAAGGRCLTRRRLHAVVANSTLLHCNNSSASCSIAIGARLERAHAKSSRFGENGFNTLPLARIGLPGCARSDANGAVDTLPLAISPLIAPPARGGGKLDSVASCRRLHRLRAEVHRVRGQPFQALVRPGAVVELEINSKLAVGFGNRAVGVQIHLLVLDAAPQSLDEHVGVSSQLRRLATIRSDVFG